MKRQLLVFAFFSLIQVAYAQTQQPSINPKTLDPFIVRIMDSAHIPGLSIAIIRNGTVAYSKGYGLTKSDSTQKVNTETIFDAASLSKPVFAYAVLQLVDEGLLDLDKPLYEYLPYPDVADDERYKQITARMVLSHRSGFPNWRKNRRSNQLAMSFTPGQRFGYSGEGYVYLQKVVEKITGKPINDIVQERVLDPLRMTRSSYIWKPQFDSNFALPHGDSGEPEPKFKMGQPNMAYSLQTTADDYARFILAILEANRLKASTAQQMLSHQTPLPVRMYKGDTLSTNLFWGLGFGLEETPTGTYLWHWGDNGSFKAYVAANVAQKQAVVYFANSSNGLSVIEPILRQTLGGEHPAITFLSYKSYKNLVEQASTTHKK